VSEHDFDRFWLLHSNLMWLKINNFSLLVLTISNFLHGLGKKLLYSCLVHLFNLLLQLRHNFIINISHLVDGRITQFEYLLHLLLLLVVLYDVFKEDSDLVLS